MQGSSISHSNFIRPFEMLLMQYSFATTRLTIVQTNMSLFSTQKASVALLFQLATEIVRTVIMSANGKM